MSQLAVQEQSLIPIDDLTPFTGDQCVVDGATEEAYFSLEAMSNSGLKNMAKGPGYYRWYQDNREQDSDKASDGSLFHLAIGEPERFEQEVICIDGSRQKKDVKEAVAEAESLGKIVTKTETRDKILRARDFVMSHYDVRPLFSNGGRPEQVLLWKDFETGVQCKARVDWLTDSGVLADWKTFDDLSDDAIKYQMRRMKYHWQAGWYTEGASRIFGRDIKMFANVFIRLEDPIDCRVVLLPDHEIEEARMIYRPFLHKYAECKRENHWPMRDMTGPMVLPIGPFYS